MGESVGKGNGNAKRLAKVVSAALEPLFDLAVLNEPLLKPAMRELTQKRQMVAFLLLKELQAMESSATDAPEVQAPAASEFLAMDLQRTREMLSRLKSEDRILAKTELGYRVPRRNILLAVDYIQTPE